MAYNPIVFIDSGVGGLPYLETAKKLMPGEQFVYVADTGNFPYGEKSAEELTKIILILISNIVLKIDPKLIVIACNTASVVALSTLREKFGIPFVGVVPAVKPACRYSVNGKIGLIATRKTIDDPYTGELISHFAANCKVEKFAAVDLVEFVEKKFFSSNHDEKMSVVSKASKIFKNKDIDSLVLGCTHFVHLRDSFKEYFGKSVDIIDSVTGVCSQISRIIQENSNNFPSNNVKSSEDSIVDKFYITGDSGGKSEYLKFAAKFFLDWGGEI